MIVIIKDKLPTLSTDIFDASAEIWTQQPPKMGDHIRVKRGLYAHHGIFVSDKEVIHFTGKDGDSILDWSKPEVIQSDLDYFLKGGILEVKEYTDEEFSQLYTPQQIVEYARACMGDKGYHLAFNNCEHFANVCTLNSFRSQQVERVLNGKLPNQEENNMGLFGTIGGFFKGLFGGGSSGGGSRSTTSTVYEPDKVKIAQIEADTKIRLAGMETDRIELMKNAQLDILECQRESQIALEQARAQGLAVMAQTILTLQEKLNEVAEKRLLIIEKGSLQIIKEIENVYNELGDKIEQDNDKYNTEKLPQLLSILEKYEEVTPAHKLYQKRIDDDMTLQIKHHAMQIENLSKRQTQIIDGFLKGKERILEQTGQITKEMLNVVQNQALELKSNHVDTLALPKDNNSKSLTDNSKFLTLPEKNVQEIDAIE